MLHRENSAHVCVATPHISKVEKAFCVAICGTAGTWPFGSLLLGDI